MHRERGTFYLCAVQNYSNWYSDNAALLSGHGLWLRGDAPGMRPPNAFDARSTRVLVCRLSSWEDTRFSFTHRLLYALYAENPQVFADLAYLPPHFDALRMRADQVPWWLAVASKRAPLDFDWLAISNALVQELVNLPILLRESGIPLLQSERMAAPRMPLLILGGANAVHASALWNPDPLVDGIFIGEDAESIARMNQILADAKQAGQLETGKGRLAVLRTLESIPGFFRPDAPRAARKLSGSLTELNRLHQQAPWVLDPECAGVASLQVSEGCPYFCSFCAESYSRKPYREQAGDSLRTQALELKTAQGLSEVELFSFNFNTHRDLEPLVTALAPDFGQIGLKSQRFDALAGNPRLLALMRLTGKASVTCGLEGCSDRIRAYLQKHLTGTEFREAASALLASPLRELKVFLIATGHENEADLAEFKSDLQWLLEELRRNPKKPRVLFSATPLVRFPWTPLEFEDATPPAECIRAVRRIKNVVVSSGFEFREAANEYECGLSQILVRAQTPAVLQAVSDACAREDFVFREGVPELVYNNILEALAKIGISEAQALAGHAPEAKVPWAILEPGVSHEFVKQQFHDSLLYKQNPICLGRPAVVGACQRCDACTPAQKKVIVGKRAPLPNSISDLVALNEQLRKDRRNDVSLSFALDLAPRAQGLPMATLQALLARAWMRVDPALAPHYRRALPGPCERERDLLRWAGLRELPLLWSAAGAQRCQELLALPEFRAQLAAQLEGWIRPASQPALWMPGPAWEWSLESPHEMQPGTWLNSLGLKHTLRKDGDRRICEFGKDALKKRIVSHLEWTRTGPNTQVKLVSLEKFAPVDFLRDAFSLPRPEEWARTQAIVTKILQSL